MKFCYYKTFQICLGDWNIEIMNHFERPSTVDCNVTTVTKEAHDLKPKTCFFPTFNKDNITANARYDDSASSGFDSHPESREHYRSMNYTWCPKKRT